MATIISTILAVVGWLITAVINKKKIKVARILKKLPEIINVCEASNCNGQTKLLIALKMVENECLHSNLKFIESQWQYEIEKILETPQKKQLEEIHEDDITPQCR